MNCDEKTLCSESTRCTSLYLKTLQLWLRGSRKTGADSRMSLNQGNGSGPKGERDVVNQNLPSENGPGRGLAPALACCSVYILAFACPVFFAQVSLENLSRATFRQSLQLKFNTARNFVSGDLRARVSQQFLLGDTHAGFAYHHRVYRFAPHA